MKKIIFILIALTSCIAVNSQNKFTIYGGANISHKYDGMNNYCNYKWGNGAFIGLGYERLFGEKWGINPRLEYSYTDNGVSGGIYEFHNVVYNSSEWLGAHNLSIPVLANFRVRLNDNLKLRIGVGPYIQAAIAGREMHGTNVNQKWSISPLDFKSRFAVGGSDEIALEINDHFSYMVGYRFGGLKDSRLNKIGSVTFGFGYTF